MVWAAKLNLLWMVFTLAGGVVLGSARPRSRPTPSPAGGHSVNRFMSWPAFVAAYRREFGRGSLLVLPLAGLTVLLVANYFYFASLGSAGTVPRLATSRRSSPWS